MDTVITERAPKAVSVSQTMVVFMHLIQFDTNSRAKKFEEKVVLLTVKALYVCSYNYNLEKVVQFKRIALETISSIQVGEYILSSLTPISRQPDQNYGFLIFYEADRELTRLNTGSIRNESLDDLDAKSTNSSSEDEIHEDSRSFLAFKAVRYNVLGELSDDSVLNCREQAEEIASKIAEACGSAHHPRFLVHQPIIR